ncbi:IclR family transcriptional regulator [Chelativorans xinjiangense]|uniref:IclR family transcriptional regulator n=1 Tax=Chelativorans xinjiangense TaxID=2681485 RepID=UPI001358B5A5|nr:IclR family transcriptional regulator [Chelativorans xinjiangense]
MNTSDSKPASRGSGIQSLERGAAILDAVAGSPDGLGLTEISGRVGLHTSTAFHLVKTLVGLGYLAQDRDGKKYRIGPRLFGLASGASRERTLLNFGLPVLEHLSAETGEASHLAVRERTDVIVVARTEGAGVLQLSERVGITRPMHATALGKVLLSYMPEKERNELIAILQLNRITEKTITDPEQLRREAEIVRSEGIAHDRAEFDPDLRCIAMPVWDFTGRCVAAIGLSGPVWRMTPDVIDKRILKLEVAAEQLSQALGYRELETANA